MNPATQDHAPKNSRRTALLWVSLLFLILVAFISVILVRKNQSRAAAESSTKYHVVSVRTSVDVLSAELPESPIIGPGPETRPTIPDAPPPPKNPIAGSDRPDRTLFFIPGQLPPEKVVAFDPESTPFGVVDVQRLLLAHPSGLKTREMWDKAVLDIRRIVAVRAIAHGFSFVLDASAESPSSTPITLLNLGVPDITEEVLRILLDETPRR